MKPRARKPLWRTSTADSGARRLVQVFAPPKTCPGFAGVEPPQINLLLLLLNDIFNGRPFGGRGLGNQNHGAVAGLSFEI